MLISNIDLPDAVMDALRGNSLVVFAGAGVSMGEPACLPDFKSLTEIIAKRTGTAPPSDNFDGFLGRLQDRDDPPNVHHLAAQELSREGLRPTKLHEDLLRLYPKIGRLRLVSTNFDLLFEQAAENVLAASPEVFRAPALPLGHEFEGIVHVHGAVSQYEQMVLTDKDFGRAYLTEGWARRFLVQLFSNFTILFVGYNHNDTIMNYLARALPPRSESRRYALTGAENNKNPDQWRSLRVEPITYPQDSQQDYSTLHCAISRLADLIQFRAVDWHREITEIAKGPPPRDEETENLVNDALRDNTKTQFFTKSATDPDWIEWLNKHVHFTELFRYGTMSEQSKTLCRWLADQFVYNHSDQLFLLIGKHNMQLHPRFWDHLAWKIGAGTESSLSPTVLSRWISLLLSAAPREGKTPDGEYIFTSNRLYLIGKLCIQLEMHQDLLMIFDAMIQCQLLVKYGYHLPGDEADENLQFNWEFPSLGKFEELDDLWDNGLNQNLSQIVNPLLDRVIRLLEDLHHTSRAWDGPGPRLESASEGRFAIETHEQNVRNDAVDVLIDSARDCLEHLAERQPEVAAQWCDRLARSESPLQRRLAVYTLSKREDLTPDDRIWWLLKHFDLHEHSLRYEIHSVVRQNYPAATPESRESLIDKVRAYHSSGQERSQTREFDARIHLDWIHRIVESDPNCSLANQARNQILTDYPHLEPLQHPDRLSSIQSGYVGLPSHLTVEDLLSLPLSDSLNILLYFEADIWSDTLIRRQIDTLSQAIQQNFHWSMQLADAMASDGKWDAYPWRALIDTWSSLELDLERHSQVFGWLEKTELYSKHSYNVADALHALVKNDGPSYALNLLPDANRIAVALWTSLDRNLDLDPDRGWYRLSADYPLWGLTNYWLSSAALWWKSQNPRPTTLSDTYKQVFSEIINDPSHVGMLAKSILAGDMAFLLHVDRDWTQTYLLPIFDPCIKDCQSENFQAVWDGFLAKGRLYTHVAEAMTDLFLRVIPWMQRDFTDRRAKFVRHYTTMVIHFVDAPLIDWIPKLFDQVSQETSSPDSTSEQSRQASRTTAEIFAEEIGSRLWSMPQNDKNELWKRWLKDYWQKRVDRAFSPLTFTESKHMLDWLVDLKDVFPETVELAIQMPPPRLENTRIVGFLAENRTWESHPEAVAQLFIYLSKCIELRRYLNSTKEIVDALIGSDISSELKLDLEDIRVQLSD